MAVMTKNGRNWLVMVIGDSCVVATTKASVMMTLKEDDHRLRETMWHAYEVFANPPRWVCTI